MKAEKIARKSHTKGEYLIPKEDLIVEVSDN